MPNESVLHVAYMVPPTGNDVFVMTHAAGILSSVAHYKKILEYINTNYTLRFAGTIATSSAGTEWCWAHGRVGHAPRLARALRAAFNPDVAAELLASAQGLPIKRKLH